MMNPDALLVAFTPVGVLIGSAIAYYAATETGDDDPAPTPRRGAPDFEPWGIPQAPLIPLRLPGDSVTRSHAYGDTGYLPRYTTKGTHDAA